MKKIITTIIAIAVVTAVVLGLGITSEAAGNIVKSGPSLVHQPNPDGDAAGRVNQEDYYDVNGKTFMSDLKIGNCVVDLTGITPTTKVTGDIEWSDQAVSDVYGYGSKLISIHAYTTINPAFNKKTNLNGTIKQIFEKGVTLADGSKADLVVDCHDFEIFMQSTKENPTKKSTVGLFGKDTLHPTSYNTQDTFATGLFSCGKYTCDLSIQKNGEIVEDAVFFFGTYDLDVAGRSEKTDGSGLWERKYSSKSQYPEAVSIDKTSVCSDIHLTTSSFMDTATDGNMVTLRNGKSYQDTESFDSGFAVSAKGSITFTWTGNTCSTDMKLGNQLLARNIIATTSGIHKDGGELVTDALGYNLTTDNGTFSSYLTAADGATIDYDLKVKEHYKLGTVTVDGQKVEPTKVNNQLYTYSFEKIKENHAIDAQFIGPDVTYQWEGPHPNVDAPEGAVNITPGDYAVDTAFKPGDTVREAKDGQPGIWTFKGWDRTGTIQVLTDTVIKGTWEFSPTWTITTEAVNGTITETETGIPDGAKRTVEYSPNEGYQLSSVTVDGKDVPADEHPESFLFENITANHAVKVVFEKTKHKIETEVVGGTIDPDATVEHGGGATIHYSPDEGHHLNSVEVDGEKEDIKDYASEYLFTNVTGNHRIKVVYEPDTFTIETSVKNGTIDETVTGIPFGENRTIQYAPDAGCHLESIKVDDKEIDITKNPESYELENITADHKIEVVYEVNRYKIKTEIVNGTIDPDVVAEQGSDHTVAYAPDAGYHIESVIVDGERVDAESFSREYTFKNIDRDHEIRVVCERNRYTIKTSVENGRIDPDTDVFSGDDKTITYEPDEGYHLASVTVDGEAVDPEKNPASYSFLNIDRNHEIRAVYEINKYTITTEVVNGTIDPDAEVEYGSDQTITYAPDKGCQLYSVEVDGEIIDAPEKYDFTRVKENHKIRVVYEKTPDLAIDKSSDKTNYRKGETVVYTLVVTQETEEAEARDVTVTDTLPEGLTLDADSLKENDQLTVVTAEARAFEVKIDRIRDSYTLTYRATVSEDTDLSEFQNIAKAKAGNVPKEATDEHKIYRPVVSIEKSVNPEEAASGETVAFTITVKQTQEGACLNNAVIKDNAVEGLVVDQKSVKTAGDAGTVTFETDASETTDDAQKEVQDTGQEKTAEDTVRNMVVSIPELKKETVITFNAKVTARTGDLTNVAVLTGDELNDPLTASAVLKVKEAGLSMEKITKIRQAMVGDVVTYTIKLTGKNAKGIKVTDKLPKNMTYLKGSSNRKCQVKNRTIVFKKIDSLDGNMTITYKAKAVKAGKARNVAVVAFENNPGEDLESDAVINIVSPPVKKASTPIVQGKGGPIQTGDKGLSMAFAGLFAIVGLTAGSFRKRRA